MQNGSIPIVIGVTGARLLREEDLPALREAVRNEIRGIRGQCPTSRILLMTGMAEGADQLCAREALAEGCGLIACLPMAQAEYEKDFAGEALESLRELCSLAEETFVVPEAEPHLDTRDYLYRQEGIYVAQHCHVLIAVWNGSSEKPDGCGTAETIGFRRNHSYRQGTEENLTVIGGPMIIIRAGRIDETSPAEKAGTVIRFQEDILREELLRTEQFNTDAARSRREKTTFPVRSGEETVMSRIEAVYGMADAMSRQNAARFRATLAAVSAAATILTMAFLLYDEMSLHWMIIVCCAMLAGLFAINRLGKRIPAHRKYTEYRLLAEGLRVQAGLFRAGTSTEVREIMPETWQMKVPWTIHAITAICAGKKPEDARSIREEWIADQQQYHQKALERTRVIRRRNDRILRVVLILTVLSYIAGLLFEVFRGGLFSGQPALFPEEAERWRTWLKIVMGTLSAVTIFAGNYYGKLSLEETENDHLRMIRLFSVAEERAAREGETPGLLYRLAREELNENISWYTYRNVNKPDLGI